MQNVKLGIIYYTDNRLEEPILSVVKQKIKEPGLPIVSASLKPIDFGKNIVLDLSPSYLTMIKQITAALEASTAEYVFFCEHDVLYPASHFEFTPKRDDIYYYNGSVWRWKYPEDFAITYDRLISLSGLCVSRKLVLGQYKRRLEIIEKEGWESDKTREPLWARQWGYEPGTKKKKRGGFSDDDFEVWFSREPMIDIRHGRTFSQSKVTLDSFKHKPVNWQETTLDKIPGWDLNQLFSL